jgi:DNA-binding response OmpR family regulator
MGNEHLKRILVVDDHPENLDVLVILFEDEGYDVSALTDSTRLKDRIYSFSPDLIIMDVMMGRDNGIDLCKTLKTDESTAGILVLLMTASHRFHHLDKSDCMADGFIEKPFDIDEVAAMVTSLLGR